MPRTKKLSKAALKTLELLKAKAAARKNKQSKLKSVLSRKKKTKPEAPEAPLRKGNFTKQELEHFRAIILEKKKEINSTA